MTTREKSITPRPGHAKAHAKATGHAKAAKATGHAKAPRAKAPRAKAPASAGQVIDLATCGTAIRAWIDAGFHPAIAEAMASDPGASLRLLAEVGRAR